MGTRRAFQARAGDRERRLRGYQAYLILLPAEGLGGMVMTNSDNGSILAEALIRRAAELYAWPQLGMLED